MLVLSPLLVLLTIAARMLQQRDLRRTEIAGVVGMEIEGEEVDASPQEEKRAHTGDKVKAVRFDEP